MRMAYSALKYCFHSSVAGLKLVDKQETKQIDRLRLVRNKQCSHLADSQIPENEKVAIFTEVGEVYDQLNWVKDKLQTIERDVFITDDFKEVRKKLEEEKRAGNCRSPPSSVKIQ